jgi:hypothetical protein
MTAFSTHSAPSRATVLQSDCSRTRSGNSSVPPTSRKCPKSCPDCSWTSPGSGSGRVFKSRPPARPLRRNPEGFWLFRVAAHRQELPRPSCFRRLAANGQQDLSQPVLPLAIPSDRRDASRERQLSIHRERRAGLRGVDATLKIGQERGVEGRRKAADNATLPYLTA